MTIPPSPDFGVARADPFESAAVLIGVGDYRSDFPAVPQAVNCVNLVAEQFGSDVWGVRPPLRLIPLPNPDRQTVLQTVGTAARMVGPSGVLVLHFVGHAERHNGQLCLAMSDSNRSQPLTSMVTVSDLVRVVDSNWPRRDGRRLPTRVILLLDCCFAGQAAPHLPGEAVTVAEAAGWHLIGAADRDRPADAAPHAATTLFTGALLDVLVGMPGRGRSLRGIDVVQGLSDRLPADHQPVHYPATWAATEPWLKNLVFEEPDPVGSHEFRTASNVGASSSATGLVSLEMARQDLTAVEDERFVGRDGEAVENDRGRRDPGSGRTFGWRRLVLTSAALVLVVGAVLIGSSSRWFSLIPDEGATPCATPVPAVDVPDVAAGDEKSAGPAVGEADGATLTVAHVYVVAEAWYVDLTVDNHDGAALTLCVTSFRFWGPGVGSRPSIGDPAGSSWPERIPSGQPVRGVIKIRGAVADGRQPMKVGFIRPAGAALLDVEGIMPMPEIRRSDADYLQGEAGSIDLDEASTDGNTHDLLYTGQHLNGASGALAFFMPSDQRPGFNTCDAITHGTRRDPISRQDLTAGAHICVKTSEQRIAQLAITTAPAGNLHKFQFDYVVWNKPGDPESAAGPSTCSAMSPSTGLISDPADGADVTEPVVVTGRASSPASGHQMWLTVRREDLQNMFPANGEWPPGTPSSFLRIDRDCTWKQADVHFGESGYRYELSLVDVGPCGVENIKAYFDKQRSDGLPTSEVICDATSRVIHRIWVNLVD